MLRQTLSLSLLLGLAMPAHAEIFRCVGIRNLPTYQNFPCDVDSPARAPSTVASLPPATASPRSRQHGVDDAETSSEPRIGMSARDVRRLWGEPINSTTEEFARANIEIWTYPGARSVEFDRKGRVTAIHR